MRLKKVIAVISAVVMSLCVFAVPASGLQAQAAPGDVQNKNEAKVYTTNSTKDISSISIQTPEATVKMYAGLSWEALEDHVGIRLNVSNSGCGPRAHQAINNLAASIGANVVKVLDMDLEKYVTGMGWSQDVEAVNSPIRVGMTLPAGSDLTKDYAIISIRENGALEILGDIDPDPATITVDSSYFDTFAIIAAKPGTFNAFKIASPHALDQVWVSNYVKKIASTVDASANAYMLYDIGVITDAATVKRAAGGQNVSLTIGDVEPGPNARNALQFAIKQTGAKRTSYYEVQMKNGKGERVTKTNQKLRITMTVPYDFPAYADYAVAVLNADGSVSILKDIDANDCTVTIDTDQFRTYAIVWGAKGAFDLLP